MLGKFKTDHFFAPRSVFENPATATGKAINDDQQNDGLGEFLSVHHRAL
jgi:hypothetical protein